MPQNKIVKRYAPCYIRFALTGGERLKET